MWEADAPAHAAVVKAVEHIGRSLSHLYTGLGEKSLDEYVSHRENIVQETLVIRLYGGK
jgi:hypothetical protein